MPFSLIYRLFSLCLVTLAVAFGAGRAWAAGEGGKAAGPAIAAAVSVEAEGAKTRFKVTLSKAVAAQVSVMERPDRVIVDLPEVAFHLPPEAGRGKEGLIASYRYGLFAPGRSRVVMELTQPAVVSGMTTALDSTGAATILTIELSRAEREEFRRAAAESSGATKEVPAPLPVQEARDSRPIIMIDPGHGGIDPGAASSGNVVEKDLVLAFAQRLRQKLEESGRYKVLMTRDHDVFISLGDRVRAARTAQADLFISIHADSIAGGQDVRGLTVYTGAERASDADSARLADRENKADAVAGIDSADMPDDVSDILMELTLRETRGFSHHFATRLVGEFDSVARLNKNPHRQARFQVLRAHDVPSVLVELGYLSSQKDLDLLMSEDWRGKMVSAMSVAVDRFFAARLARRGAAAVLP
ncbi:N-acetylmuramoyl-L-alanine amidase [Microvirga flocculans]|uniref:N-acetylmuramoyl-L-alanine amidase n=1 Tax=Microvirga flocculans TaxID=217168 RepID=A0A7W6N9R3_9HYPH|nr:N-acetylmuramoyl-L-alanine amidase [Microvirga flocculans]MBB4041941.1 N-acetylmuramoyl-L-alanine amidase [Microvirga flocculans]